MNRLITNLHRSKVPVLMRGRHTHVGVDRGRWRGAVRSSCWAGVVLRPTPAQANSRVTDRVALHLVDCHLRGVALNELNESAALSWWDLDVGDFTKALEERAEFILGDIARETTDEHSGVIGISELVHRLRCTVVTHRGSTTHGRRVHPGRRTASWHTTHGSWSDAWTLVLRSRSRDAHGTVAAVDTLHFAESTLLVILIRETDESVPTRHAADGIGHDLGGFARRESVLEQRNQDVFVDLGTKITNEDGELGATVITAMGEDLTLTRYILSDRI